MSTTLNSITASLRFVFPSIGEMIEGRDGRQGWRRGSFRSTARYR
jgi:hypothetical protein